MRFTNVAVLRALACVLGRTLDSLVGVEPAMLRALVGSLLLAVSLLASLDGGAIASRGHETPSAIQLTLGQGSAWNERDAQDRQICVESLEPDEHEMELGGERDHRGEPVSSDTRVLQQL